MSDVYFELEQDADTELKEVRADRFDELRESGKGLVHIGLPDGTVHHIAGSRYLSTGISAVHTGGEIEIRRQQSTVGLRRYHMWAWFEGDNYKKHPGGLYPVG